jgi:hypothetical protein
VTDGSVSRRSEAAGEKLVSSYDAKFHLVLADRLKAAARASSELTPEAVVGFQAEVERERARLSDTPAGDLDLIIGGKDARRLRRYNTAAWTLAVVPLESCRVADGMGGKSWVRGLSVPEAATKFLTREGEKGRVWHMKFRTQLFLDSLPIIVVAGAAEYQIDDGSHRAVAAWLAGHQHVTAFLGRA